MKIFNAYFTSKIRYGLEAYGITSKKNIKKLQIQQNRALKILFNKDIRTNTKELHRDLQILMIKDLQRQCLAQIAYKNQSNEHNRNTQFSFEKNKDIHTYNTRQNNNLHVPHYKTKIGKQTIEYTVPKIWNDLPATIQEASNYNKFKKEIKQYYLRNY